MKKIIMIAAMVMCSTAFAKEKTTTVATIRGNSMAEVQMKVDQFLQDLKTDKKLKQLLPRICNPTSNRRVVRKAYSINFSSGDGSYVVTGSGDWVKAGASAQVKVSCTSYKKD